MKPGLSLSVATAVACLVVTSGCSSYDGGARHMAARQPPTAVVSHGAPASVARPAALPVRSPAIAVLHEWDRRRARAWATGDPEALADLYVRGSAAGRTDVALLRSYLRRGLRVRGLRMQVFAVGVVGHSPGRWRLRVTDRLERAVAVGSDAALPLPRDRASTRLLTLVRGADGRWRVAAVRAVTG